MLSIKEPVSPSPVRPKVNPEMSSSECESSCKVSDPQHSQKLLRVLRTFWLEQSFHDALVVVGAEELPVQKNILAAASPYIRSGLGRDTCLRRSVRLVLILLCVQPGPS